MRTVDLNYEQVPNIISCKDLDYLSDMFEWSYNGYKTTKNASSMIEDPEIRDLFLKSSNIFEGNLTTILTILEQGGQNESTN